MADGDGHLLVGDQVFEMDFGRFVFDDGAALVAVLLLDFFELLHDDVAQLLLRSEDRFVLGNVIANMPSARSRISSMESLVRRYSCSSRMASTWRAGERLLRIALGRAPGGVDVDLLAAEVGDQVVARIGAVGAGADDRDDVIEMIERDQVAFENVLALRALSQQVGSAAANHVDAVVDEVPDGLHETQFPGLAVDHGQQDHAEAFLHLGVLVELVEHDLGFGAALELDDDAHAVAIALVANVGDVVDHLVVHQVGDALDEPRLVDLVRNFGDDDGLLVLRRSFRWRPWRA